MTEPKNTQPSLPEDERKNPVYRLGQAVAGFMLVVWAGVLVILFLIQGSAFVQQGFRLLVMMRNGRAGGKKGGDGKRG